MKENKYPPEFEKLYTEMTEDELKKFTYVGYLHVKKCFDELMKAVEAVRRKKNNSDI